MQSEKLSAEQLSIMGGDHLEQQPETLKNQYGIDAAPYGGEVK